MASGRPGAATHAMTEPFRYRVGFLGCPVQPDVPWTRENLKKLTDLGFNVIQLNIAWGSRPGDEPLNLEDVVDVAGLADCTPGLPLRSGATPAQIAQRRANLRDRIALCRELGLRTLFHFGAPYNMHCRFGDSPPNCLCDPAVIARHVRLLEAFARQFPGVDDLLVYTYDQDAWLCSEFGECPRCRGVPLHTRVSAFVNGLAETWRRLSPAGRLWWEPWELSAGQSLKAIAQLDAGRTGLMLHANTAEVMATLPVDRWLRNAAHLAQEAGLPVIVEYFLGGPTEEVEPFQHLPWPLTTLRGLKAIAALGVAGIKEYYGLVPTAEDPNLRLTGLFLNGGAVDEAEALQRLAQPYGAAAVDMAAFWRATSAAMELFPWATSWYIREIGRCDPCHSMEAAFIRGQQAHTPSWESSRHGIFMKTDNVTPDPWMLEDVQLQCELASERLAEALRLGGLLRSRIPALLCPDFDRACRDIAEWNRRVLSYVYHTRETNLATILRHCLAVQQPVPERVISELRAVLEADRRNQGVDEPCAAALALLAADPRAFADRYFMPAVDPRASKGGFSVTSA